MKKIIIMLIVGLLTQQATQAQETVYLSNLGETSAGNLAVGSDSWPTAMFQTGNNAGGYLFNSVQLAMTDPSGSPANFTVMLYDVYNTGGPRGSEYPALSLGTLDGSLNPVSGGIYTYSPASSLTLSPDTPYCIVLTAGTAVASGAYDWSYATATPYPGGWQILGSVLTSSNGSTPWGGIFGASPQFAISATAVPEPGVLSLFVVCGLLFGLRRQKDFSQ